MSPLKKTHHYLPTPWEACQLVFYAKWHHLNFGGRYFEEEEFEKPKNISKSQ